MSNSRTHSFVRITSAGLDEVGSDIILRGVIDNTTMGNLLVDDYQREILPGASLDNLVKAFRDGSPVPDIVLGVRGLRYKEEGDAFVLMDPVYIIDGLQRVTGLRTVLTENPDAKVRLGAAIHFGTTREWERERFGILNADRIKVSPNVLARNMRDSSPAIGALYSLCESDRSFVLYGRICWTQRMRRNETSSTPSS